MNEPADTTLEQRLHRIAEERDRLEREQESLRGDAEAEMRRIDPMIAELREKIEETEREIEALENKRAEIEKFLQRLNTRSHPLRRAAVA